MPGGKQFGPQFADRAGQAAGLVQGDAWLVARVLMSARNKPDVPGRGSNARIDRGGPHQVRVRTVRGFAVLKAPLGRSFEGVAHALNGHEVFGDGSWRLQASIGY